ncbi:MAG: 4Fe-4S dicluster domain-containing protein, partial [Chloroflexota bacterium]
GDLSVDTGSYFREMGQHIESWIHTNKVFDAQAVEERMANEQAQAIYELDRCIECGCCLAACATRLMREDFIGAAGLLRLARFLADPRDQRGNGEAFKAIGTDDGIFGCIGLLACDDYCPKKLPLEKQLAYMRRRMLRAGLQSRSSPSGR